MPKRPKSAPRRVYEWDHSPAFNSIFPTFDCRRLSDWREARTIKELGCWMSAMLRDSQFERPPIAAEDLRAFQWTAMLALEFESLRFQLSCFESIPTTTLSELRHASDCANWTAHLLEFFSHAQTELFDARKQSARNSLLRAASVLFGAGKDVSRDDFLSWTDYVVRVGSRMNIYQLENKSTHSEKRIPYFGEAPPEIQPGTFIGIMYVAFLVPESIDDIATPNVTLREDQSREPAALACARSVEDVLWRNAAFVNVTLKGTSLAPFPNRPATLKTFFDIRNSICVVERWAKSAIPQIGELNGVDLACVANVLPVLWPDSRLSEHMLRSFMSTAFPVTDEFKRENAGRRNDVIFKFINDPTRENLRTIVAHVKAASDNGQPLKPAVTRKRLTAKKRPSGRPLNRPKLLPFAIQLLDKGLTVPQVVTEWRLRFPNEKEPLTEDALHGVLKRSRLRNSEDPTISTQL